MRITIIVALAAASTALPASAQVYRCGSTYSQTPCDAGAKPTRIITTDAVPEGPPPASRGAALCAAQAPARLGLLDPDSARISSVAKGPAESIQYAGQPTLARQYVMTINAKNKYGGYIGPQPYRCYLSEDEARILKVEGPPTEADAQTPSEARISAAARAYAKAQAEGLATAVEAQRWVDEQRRAKAQPKP